MKRFDRLMNVAVLLLILSIPNYSRVDSPQAASFISCVMTANSVTEVCECGIEAKFGLCD